MSYFDPRAHHLEGLPEQPMSQMGQPTDLTFQRQQTDLWSGRWGDSHGVERELQFADLERPVPQAMG